MAITFAAWGFWKGRETLMTSGGGILAASRQQPQQ
eukprot:CAMPEP_0174307278 /NCGR_PEP_ID=MMETSP0810-20121108/1016_1 /TAXON_ID=73025 ORGANISM="Eutreptiella gymnastica-like, Strain CCMP1594" /NCGR_SAMPLE_ID=MMETSP0810 /ASSEMBLY_ACC=CAM_ASM_000659 /LENGTH=34 /DNA_ID= /DNA_START= /DNA_END= /DNA_ORIENTATION=